MGMRTVAALLLLGFQALAARAGDRLDVRGELDGRLIFSDASPSFLEGGFGRQRFDPDHEDFRLGRAFVDARLRLTDTLTAHAVIDTYGDGDKHAVDASEAYIDYRPFPGGPWRWRVRGGLFYAPISLENRGPGWSNVYAISDSAISTWIGEEIRTVGIEGEARWRGQALGRQDDLVFVLGVYGWNDPAGVLVAERGFALHDRQTATFGHIAMPGTLGQAPGRWLELFHEIDGRAGDYAGLTWHHQASELRVLHYDNRADPEAFDQYFAWQTRFNVAGFRLEPDERWTLVLQILDGTTVVGGNHSFLDTEDWRLQAGFAMASYAWGANRVTARYDRFRTWQRQGSSIPDYDDDGSATAIAYLRDFGEHWQVATEWLRIQSHFQERDELGQQPNVTEAVTQLAVRYRFRVQR